MIAFLQVNDWSFDAEEADAERKILALAASELDKPTLTQWVRQVTHQKPSMELRRFFSSIDANTFFDAVRKLHTKAPGSSRDQVLATVYESMRHVPFLLAVAEIYNEAQARGDETTSTATLTMLKCISALIRIAEDMGYEW